MFVLNSIEVDGTSGNEIYFKIQDQFQTLHVGSLLCPLIITTEKLRSKLDLNSSKTNPRINHIISVAKLKRNVEETVILSIAVAQVTEYCSHDCKVI